MRSRDSRSARLAHRVEPQHHVTEGPGPGSTVDRPRRPCRWRVPHLEQHARIRRLVRGWNVEVRRDVETGLTLVYDLLQPITRAVEGANRPGVEGRWLGHTADQLPERFATDRCRTLMAADVVNLAISVLRRLYPASAMSVRKSGRQRSSRGTGPSDRWSGPMPIAAEGTGGRHAQESCGWVMALIDSS